MKITWTLAATIALFCAVPLLVGCTTHIAPYVQKQREFEQGDYAEASHRPANGSLYAAGTRGLLEDDRASRVGDIVIIHLEEDDSATHDASTSLGKKSARSIGLSGGLVDALQKAVPAVQLASLLGLDSSSQFDGQGAVKRGGKLSASLPVRIRKVLPNSDLYLEGTKVLMVGNEEHHLYISGIIRQVDLLGDGSVSSSRVADAEIEYTGRGDISDQQRQGWVGRTLDKVSPF